MSSSFSLSGVGRTSNVFTIIFSLFCLSALVQPANADAGDVIAGLIGAFMAIIVFCAFLGWWSRRSGGGSGGSSSSSSSSHSSTDS